MKILVVGAGAVGGYFGARLAQAGRDVSFLVRPARAEQLRRDGLRLISPHGDATLTPHLLVGGGAVTAPFDLVLVSVKAYALEAAMADFAPAVGPETVILPLLNGMKHIDSLENRFGAAAVLGGVCRVMTEIDAQGRIVQFAPMQELLYGARDGAATPPIAALDAALQGAGFDATVSPDIVQAMWDKWVQLASLGAATCLLRGAVGAIVAAPGGAEVVLRILEECAAIAAACGHKPSEAFLAGWAAALTAPGSPMTASMYRDLRKGAPVEADHIVGDLLARRGAAGPATPLLEAAFVNLRVYQAGLSSG